MGGRKRQPHPKPVCRICTQDIPPRQQTKEDAHPLWIRKLILEWFRAFPQEVFVDPKWEQQRRSILKPVCQKCQRRLNETFEIPARPLLQAMMDGSALALTPSQQAIVAGWIAKTILVLALCPTNQPAAAEQVEELRSYLYSTLHGGAPPDNATIRIAYVTENLDPPQRGFVPAGWPDPNRIQFFSISGYPHLLCEMIVSSAQWTFAFIDTTEDDDRFLRIWPPQLADALWPPPSLLGLLDIEAFLGEWGRPADIVTSDFPTMALGKPHDM